MVGVDGKDVFAEDVAGDTGLGTLTGSDSSAVVPDSSADTRPDIDSLVDTNLFSFLGAGPEELLLGVEAKRGTLKISSATFWSNVSSLSSVSLMFSALSLFELRSLLESKEQN